MTTETAPRQQPWKPQTTIEDNPIGLPKDVAEQIAPHLDEHVASLFVQFHQYQKHHWLVEGPQFRDLHKFLQKSYEKVHDDLDDIAERMTALGAFPTSSPANQAKIAYVEHEPEGEFHIREMLTADLNAEGRIAERMRTTIELCFRLGDYGTETLLKEILLRVEDRAHELDHFLGTDSLGMFEVTGEQPGETS